MEAMVPLFLVSLVVGLAVGVLAGLLGIGGGMLLVPAFKLGYAMDSLMCTATSLFTIIPTSVSGAISHIRNKTCLPKLGRGRGPRGRLPVAFRGVARPLSRRTGPSWERRRSSSPTLPLRCSAKR